MPIFLNAPTYGPRGPHGQGWNRLSLNAHFGVRHQRGLLTISYVALFDSMTGRQSWGGVRAVEYEQKKQTAFEDCGVCEERAAEVQDQLPSAYFPGR
ncbi:hypothetical protein [Streptomyces yaizuensis]|uniref:Uncharacterized protein n=1 Tax=Streptomyces yaizuensis TaxID=2989713 RepID=A0ABQ5PBM5_9ACTN|nr:hypothetical protein [Streptomyces sp. YSPA8]GLF99920.1 hypothetical protein SYYSPA8_36505 [Streptomyces sp. YSPA8]